MLVVKAHWVLLLVLLLFSASGVTAQLLKVGLSQNTAPEKQGNTLHFESELVRQLLTELGHQVEFVAAPHARLKVMLKNNELDMAVRQDGVPMAGLYYSPPYLEFHNLVFALADFSGTVRTVQDLGRYSVSSFKNASNILGPEFSQAVKSSPSYREVVDQDQAIDMLQQGRTELLVLDKVTFYRRWSEKGYNPQLVQSFDLFAKSRHHIAFVDQKLQKQVSQLLKQWQQSGRVTALQLQIRQQNQSMN